MRRFRLRIGGSEGLMVGMSESGMRSASGAERDSRGGEGLMVGMSESGMRSAKECESEERE